MFHDAALSKFYFSELTGPGFTYQVHREEVLAPDGPPTTGNSPMGPNRVLGLGDMGKGNELEKSGLTGAPYPTWFTAFGEWVPTGGRVYI